ncbi:hypothetical protein LJC61_05100 [Ruminococcaceae bacterium OttesenSCG-928-A16]|nr:hypothetical protein [Ruminococcaceae bacterium OttesenSCG-928-A16]
MALIDADPQSCLTASLGIFPILGINNKQVFTLFYRVSACFTFWELNPSLSSLPLPLTTQG